MWAGDASALSADSLGDVGGESLRGLALRKEKELHDINDYRIRSLEQAVAEKDQGMQALRERFGKLRQDFQYNLKLIESRDEELQKYDQTFSQLKALLRDKEAELSELKVRLDETESRVSRESEKVKECELMHADKIKDLKTAAESARWAVEDAHRRDKEAFQTLKLELERQLRQKEDDLDMQRRELEAAYDTVARQKASAFQRQLEDRDRELRELEARQRTQGDELSEATAKVRELSEEKDELAGKLEMSEKKVKALTWELEDVRKLKDAKISELYQEKDDLGKVKQRILDEYEAKMADLLTSLHAVEKQFVQQQEHYEQQLQNEMKRKDHEVSNKTLGLEARLNALMEKLREAEEHVEAQRADFSRAKWDLEEQLTIKSRQVETLKAEIDSIQIKRESQTQETKSHTAEKAAEIVHLRDALEKVRGELMETEKKLTLTLAELEAERAAVAEANERMAGMEQKFIAEFSKKEEAIRAEGDRLVVEVQTQRDRLMSANTKQEQAICDLENTVTGLKAELSTVRSEMHNAWLGGAEKRPGSSSSSSDRLWLENQQAADQTASAIDRLFDGDLGPSSPLGSFASQASSLQNPGNNLDERAQLQSDLDQYRQSEKTGEGHVPWAEYARLQEQIQLAQTENQKLSEALRLMRSDMESMAHTPPAQNPAVALEESESSQQMIATAMGDGSSKSTQRPEDVIAEENRLLNEQAQKLYSYIGLLQGKSPLDPARDAECQILRDLLETQASQLALMRKTPSYWPGASGVDRASAEKAKVRESELKAELDDLRASLERIIQERDKLVELSNKLSAELKRSSSSSVSAEQLRQVEKQVAETFKSKVKSVEQALEQIVQQNRSLKGQLQAYRTTEQERLKELVPTPKTVTKVANADPNGDYYDDDDDSNSKPAPGIPSDSAGPSSRGSFRKSMTARRKNLGLAAHRQATAGSLSNEIKQGHMNRQEARAIRSLNEVASELPTGSPVSRAQNGRDTTVPRPSTARERLELARKRLERAGKAGHRVQVGKTKIRNYAFKDDS